MNIVCCWSKLGFHLVKIFDTTQSRNHHDQVDCLCYIYQCIKCNLWDKSNSYTPDIPRHTLCICHGTSFLMQQTTSNHYKFLTYVVGYTESIHGLVLHNNLPGASDWLCLWLCGRQHSKLLQILQSQSLQLNAE